MWSYTYTPAGSTDVTGTPLEGTFTDVRILDADGNDVTHEYEILVHPGTLEVTPASATVTITENGGETDYDGMEHTVRGYRVSIDDPLYTESDFVYLGAEDGTEHDLIRGTDAGVYEMNLNSS